MSSQETKSRRYFVETWGCQMNVHDAEKIAGRLKTVGFRPTEDVAEADVIVLNTCSVREKAQEKVFARLGELKKLKSGRKPVIGLAGCVAQQEGEAVFARAPHVDFVLGTQSIASLPEILHRVTDDGEKVVEIGRHPGHLDAAPEQIERVPGVKAYTTIMEGCDNFCTFCIVPFTRGRERCRTVKSILLELRSLAREGFKEVQLLGQNVNSYVDPNDGRSFAELLDAVHEVEGIERIRFTSPHPKDFHRSVLERYRDLPKLCPHMHLPAQSGSTSVLERMRRGYSRQEYLARVDEARGLVADIALSTDLIVGFPGETDREFEETLSLIERVRFDNIFSFKYSPRPFTLAHRRFPDDVPDAVKGERLALLQGLQQSIQIRKNTAFIGSVVCALVDGTSRKASSVLCGRTPHNRVVNFPGKRSWMGRFVSVRVTKAGPNSLHGEAVGPAVDGPAKAGSKTSQCL